jgi:hypothetical protein
MHECPYNQRYIAWSVEIPTKLPLTKLLACILSAIKTGRQISGTDPRFQVRGGALKKIAPSGGRREHFWGISCEKSRFYAKKSYFFPILRGARGPPPLGSAPGFNVTFNWHHQHKMIFIIFSGRDLQDSQHSYRHQYSSILSKYFFFRVKLDKSISLLEIPDEENRL